MAPLPHTPRIPDIPGDLVPSPFVDELRSGVAQLCQQNKAKYITLACSSTYQELNSHSLSRFPGSQPVSFGQSDLTRLENEEYVTLYL